MPERLRKSSKDSKEKMLFGVCGGLGEYLDIDSTLIRVGFVLLTFASGLGLLASIVLALLMPSAPLAGQPGEPAVERQASASEPGAISEAPTPPHPIPQRARPGGGASRITVSSCGRDVRRTIVAVRALSSLWWAGGY